MPTISNPGLSIRKNGSNYDIQVSCNINWWRQERDFPNVLYNAEMEFWGSDGGLRGADDHQFTLIRPVLGPGGLNDRRPSRLDDRFSQSSRGGFTLNEDDGWANRTDEIYVRLRLVPADLQRSNEVQSPVVTGRF